MLLINPHCVGFQPHPDPMRVMFGQVGGVSSQTGMHYMYTLSEEAIAMSTQVKEDELSFPDTFENANVFLWRMDAKLG